MLTPAASIAPLCLQRVKTAILMFKHFDSSFRLYSGDLLVDDTRIQPMLVDKSQLA